MQLIGQVVYPPGLPSLHRVRVHAMAAMALARARGRRARSDGVVRSMYVMYASELQSPMSLMMSGGTPMRWAKVAPSRRKLCPENSDGLTQIFRRQERNVSTKSRCVRTATPPSRVGIAKAGPAGSACVQTLKALTNACIGYRG